MDDQERRRSSRPTSPFPGQGQSLPAAANKNRRTRGRITSIYNAAFDIGTVRYTVELCDISHAGAQIHIRRGLMPFAGQKVVFSFMTHSDISAQIVWTRGSLAGLRFDEPLPDDADLEHFDELGAGYFKAVLKFQFTDR